MIPMCSLPEAERRLKSLLMEGWIYDLGYEGGDWKIQLTYNRCRACQVLSGTELYYANCPDGLASTMREVGIYFRPEEIESKWEEIKA